MQAISEQVGDTVNQVLVDMQFQDRVSQILSHVQEDTTKLTEAMQADQMPDQQQWFASLEKNIPRASSGSYIRRRFNTDNPRTIISQTVSMLSHQCFDLTLS